MPPEPVTSIERENSTDASTPANLNTGIANQPGEFEVRTSASSAAAQILAAKNLLQMCQIDYLHTYRVTRLALCLFDELRPLHHFGEEQRHWLEIAALLHDIGWIEGQHNHHKASLRIILTTHMLPLDSKERLIVGSIARYHRKSLPSTSHDHFRALDPESQNTVCTLAAILRMADGLDVSHKAWVNQLYARVTAKRMVLICTTSSSIPKNEAQDAEAKGDLLAQLFKRKLDVQWRKQKR